MLEQAINGFGKNIFGPHDGIAPVHTGIAEDLDHFPDESFILAGQPRFNKGDDLFGGTGVGR